MALAPGSRLGVYEVTGQIGAGGMGQVYRATDTALGRQVAIKILPDLFASDPERLARFEREARTLASLNHPHIATIYAVERSAGLHALVMELVEGEDLSERIARGAIPIDEALPIAKQIAEALEAAHEQGIVHRDLKPANIKLRPDGTVKVLDFGLAKAIDTTGEAADLTTSPTITSPAMTRLGMLLGTAAYMSPEQAKGRPVDKRTDIWAFGCVLYEMLTGRRAFPGEDVTDTLASVLRGEPDRTALPPQTPPDITRLITRCLVKDRKTRLPDIAIAVYEIDEWSARPDARAAALAPTAPTWSRDGKKIYYFVEPGRIYAVPLTFTPTLSAGPPTLLFAGRYLVPQDGRSYDVSPKGERFLMIKDATPLTASLPRLEVVFNWTEELKRIGPRR